MYAMLSPSCQHHQHSSDLGEHSGYLRLYLDYLVFPVLQDLFSRSAEGFGPNDNSSEARLPRSSNHNTTLHVVPITRRRKLQFVGKLRPVLAAILVSGKLNVTHGVFQHIFWNRFENDAEDICDNLLQFCKVVIFDTQVVTNPLHLWGVSVALAHC